ncbi:enoyl-CoA hydratase-related protein [Caballeronia catudaia]|uniref:enoyl-CoA hydratase-related protein n=1 Tax=Caballeronia catudaia TaxID=1777136 RepID=UPI000AB116E3|nr:enoyl-CoA hydratase-related protein [Caballeronia catudaia]
MTRPTGGVALINLNRPAQRNALSTTLLREVADVMLQAQADPAVKVVVLTGKEKFFSAGADIKEMHAGGFEALNNPSRQTSWDAIAGFRKPMIAAVQGVCFGGGLEFAMLADVIIAGQTAKFGQPEITIGILPGDGATQRLTRVVGKSLAMQMILSGEPISSEVALRAGLVSEMIPDGEVVERAISLATVFATRAPLALQLAKEAVLAAYETSLSAGLAVERRAIRYAFTTQDQREGMAAFIEKRPPVFTGS